MLDVDVGRSMSVRGSVRRGGSLSGRERGQVGLAVPAHAPLCEYVPVPDESHGVRGFRAQPRLGGALA
jgi:hypothetical protein